MKKILMFFILGIFLISLTSATLPPVKQNDCVQLKTILNTAWVNISSITYPNETTLFLNEAMTKNALTFNYSFCETDLLGVYTYDYFDAEEKVYVNDFLVTPSGKVSSVAEAILYFVLIIIMFAGSVVIFYFILILPYQNPTDEEGTVVEITKLKYLKIFLITILYPIVIIILNLMNGLAVNFMSLTIFTGIIGFLFETLLRLAWVWTVIMALWVFYLLIRDTNFRKIIKQHSLRI